MCALLAILAFEIAWRSSHAWPSPAMGVLYAISTVLAGRACAADLRKRSLAEHFVAGSIVLTIAFAALTVAGHVHLFAWAAAALASIGVVRGGARALVPRAHAADVVAGLAIAVLVARAVYYADRLPLGASHPSSFAWIDTPLWLTLAYGAERALPLPDLLFDGGTVEYHCGAFVAVAAVRRVTGVPMHVAYVLTVLGHALALCMLLAQALPRWFGVRSRLARIAVALAGVAWLEYLTPNASTLVATSLGLFALLEVTRARRWHDFVRGVVALCALALVKEVQLAMTVLVASVVTGAIFLRTRRMLPIAAVATGAAVSFVLQHALYHAREHVTFVLHRPHLFTDFLAGELERAAAWVTVGGAATVVAIGLRRRMPVLERAAAAGLACYLAGLLVWNVLLPVVTPARTAIATEWLTGDMAQFSTCGRQILVVALVLGAIAAWLRLARPNTPARLAVVALFAFDGTFSLWRSPPVAGGDDLIVPILERVDPTTSLVAADRLNWNEENPHWAAFFGHRFFVLRTGRWSTAFPHRDEMLADQKTLFETADGSRAIRIVERRGITHLVEDRTHPVPWLASRAAAFENARYRLHVMPRSLRRLTSASDGATR